MVSQAKNKKDEKIYLQTERYELQCSMHSEALRFETLDAPSLINYIKTLETTYNLRINELETNLKNIQFEHEVLKEKYDLLVYKRFARSAEQLLADEKQPLLFNSEQAKEEDAAKKIDPQEFEEVKSHVRKKKGRKAIDPRIPRVEKVIDIIEDEKTCACGSVLTKIGQETAA